jgi:predicted RNase H-like HicB family nuclease
MTYMREFSFTVLYEVDPESGNYCASVPALDLASHGRTLPEVRKMIREALELHLEGMQEENIPIPSDVTEVERITVEIADPSTKEATA